MELDESKEAFHRQFGSVMDSLIPIASVFVLLGFKKEEFSEVAEAAFEKAEMWKREPNDSEASLD